MSYYTSVHETNTESSIDLSIDLMKSTNNERRGFELENIRVVIQRVQFDLQLGLDRGKTLEVNYHQPPPTQRTFTLHVTCYMLEEITNFFKEWSDSTY